MDDPKGSDDGRPRPTQQYSDSDTRASSHPVKHVQFRRDPEGISPLRFSTDAGRTSKTMDRLKDDGRMNEHSPLLRPRDSEEVGRLPRLSSVLSPTDSEDGWVSGAETALNVQETKSSWYLFLLTLCILGLQIGWSVELSNGSPYLLGLGISKSFLALVWIAGPLSGTLVQPYVGIRSDRCRSRFGKRRPFMVGGAVATVTSLMLLSWAKEITAGILYPFGASDHAARVAAIVFATLMIYVLDFAINVIQAGCRAFIVDNAPAHQQDSANAWAARISGMGNIIGYLFGYVDLPRYFWFFGDTQFKVLCVIASTAMLSTVMISCASVHERDPRLDGEPDPQEGGIFAFFKGLYISIRKLPPQISKVCQVQFFAWIGWFPFLFYITTYIGEIYAEPFFADNPDMSEQEIDETWQRATRIGTLALFMFAITTFLSSVLLPFFIAKTYKPPAPPPLTPMTPGAEGQITPITPTTPGGTAIASGGGTGGYFGYIPPSHSDEAKSLGRSPTSRNPFARLPSPEIKWLTLRRAWMLSHLIFAALMGATFFVSTTTSATILVALIGVPWSMTNWAPFALIAAEIAKRDAIRRGIIAPPPTREGEVLARGEDESEGADQAGVVLGIHNVAIAAPQVIATLASSIIFRLMQKPRGSVGDDSVAWVLRFGGLAALMAAYLTRRVGEETKR